MITYCGTDINIEEMPQGCVITDAFLHPDNIVVISNIEDAEAVIESLTRMIKTLEDK